MVAGQTQPQQESGWVSIEAETVPAIDSQLATGTQLPLSLSAAHERVKQALLITIDDEPANVKTIAKHLRTAGYVNVTGTTDAGQAYELLERLQPDLVLLDILMPQVSGLEILRKMRANDRLQNLPVIILTAHSDDGTKRESLAAGANDFLAKPVDPCELLLRVRNVLTTKAYYDEAATRTQCLEQQVQRQAEQLVAARDAVELRYLAGKAEIATDVLHNVGNALQSVNTGVNLVACTVRDSQLHSLQRAVNLLQEHGETLPRFLTKDPRGKILPSYLVELTAELLSERERIGAEIELLTKHLEHINAVVATQQKYARLCNVAEELQLQDLLHDVEELAGASLSRHGIEVWRDYQTTPVVVTDRQKLLQVLLNVVKNGMDSIKQAHQTGMGQLRLRFGPQDSARAFIEVSDNGVGIPREHLSKIFSHGFTTKQHGHGFGLHSSANIIRELGGRIKVASPGVGQGATFRLEVPFQQGDHRHE